jgi:glutamyl-tRNA reductase
VNVPELLSLSLTARDAPLAIRERFALVADDLPSLAACLRPVVNQAVPLSTCNRFELYMQPVAGAQLDDILGRLAAARGCDSSQLRTYVRIRRGRVAVERLLRVAAGLESPVLGETQILGQVRRALEAARRERLVAHSLGALVQTAIRTGKRVQDETGLGRGALSVSRVAVDQARRALGGLTDKTVLIVGAGETGQLAAKALGPVGRLLIANRTVARARVLAGQLGGTGLPLSGVTEALSAADLVICCIGATQPVLTQRHLVEALHRRGGQPMVLIDLALPRSVEASVRQLDGVRLLNLEELVVRRAAHAASRAREVPKAEAIVADELEHAWRAWQESDTHHLVAALRQRAEAVRLAELKRSARVINSLPPEQRGAIQALTEAIVNKLLHEPTVWLKAHPTTGQMALQEIFGLAAQA